MERAAWRAGWADYRARRFEAAAQTLETTARLRPPSGSTAGFLYWAGLRAGRPGPDRAGAGAARRDRPALQVRLSRRARDRGPGPPRPRAGAPPPRPRCPSLRPRSPICPSRAPRASASSSSSSGSTRRARSCSLCPSPTRPGHHRLDRVAPRPAPPRDHRHEAGLPRVDRRGGRPASPRGLAILYPASASRRAWARRTGGGLDPALVAALICQESTFDAGAVSRAGARGLMQVMPATGRLLARDLGVRFRRARPPRSGDQPRLRHPLPAADARPLRRARSSGPSPPTTPGPTASTRGRRARDELPPRSSSRASPSPRPASTS